MWDLKYRPRIFSDVLGQEGTTRVLQARLREGKAFDTSYVFAGFHGCGKTTIARILARAMLCLNLKDGNPCDACEHCKACLDETMMAFTETDAASRGTVEDMRKLVEDLSFNLPNIPKRIYILDEAHRMSQSAQDVLLKPIEDKRVVVMFCTTELPKIRGTIGSRCEVHEIRKINVDDIFSRMATILEKEGVEFEEEGVRTVIDMSRGHVRDALNKLESVAQLGPVTLEAVRERLKLSMVVRYYDILLSMGDPQKAVPLIESACDEVGPANVAAGLAEAAMNSYRNALGVTVDFSMFDRTKAAAVHAMYGEALLNMARYFLSKSYPTALGLICDIVALCESGATVGAVTSFSSHETPPIRIEVKPTSQEVAVEARPSPPEKELVKKVPPDSDKGGLRPDGKGSLGSADIAALTTLDHNVIPVEHPRGSRDSNAPLVRRAKNGVHRKALTPGEFELKLDTLRALD